MVNYVCAFSQSELGKYFEWIISTFNALVNFSFSKIVIFKNSELVRNRKNCKYLRKSKE